MKTKIFNAWEKNICYIDEQDFEKEVAEWTIKLVKDFPNWRYKECSDADYILMKPEDWTLEVSSKKISPYQEHRYRISSKIWWFPDEPIAKYKKVNVWYQWTLTRYNIEFEDWIGFEKNWESGSLYTNDRNWNWRNKLQEAWFEVIDVD